MPLNNTDLLLVERSGVQYHMTADQLADFVGAVRDYSAVDISGRDAGSLTPTGTLKAGDRVYVGDASDDPDVGAGWAIYRVMSVSPTVYERISEQESLDIVAVATNLLFLETPTGGTITNTGGTDAQIPFAGSGGAGLMSAAQFNQLHQAAFAGGTPATNPVNINAGTQSVTLNIAQLDPLP